MKTEAVTVLRDLCEEVVSLRQSTGDLTKQLETETAAHREAAAHWHGEEEASNDLREREASLLNANAELNAELLHTREERDDARRKLGEWARFINFSIYEKMAKFIPRGRTAKEKLSCTITFLNGIETNMLEFQNDHPITIIEDRKAK